MTFPWKLLPLVAALTLTACGGGGSSGSGPANSDDAGGNSETPNNPSEPGVEKAVMRAVKGRSPATRQRHCVLL